jgi:hypothetical protein
MRDAAYAQKNVKNERNEKNVGQAKTLIGSCFKQNFQSVIVYRQ